MLKFLCKSAINNLDLFSNFTEILLISSEIVFISSERPFPDHLSTITSPVTLVRQLAYFLHKEIYVFVNLFI